MKKAIIKVQELENTTVIKIVFPNGDRLEANIPHDMDFMQVQPVANEIGLRVEMTPEKVTIKKAK